MRPRPRALLPLACLLAAAGCEKQADVETLSPTVGRIVESFTEPANQFKTGAVWSCFPLAVMTT